MKFNGLLIAIVVLAGLAGGVYWSDKSDKAKEKEPAKDAPLGPSRSMRIIWI